MGLFVAISPPRTQLYIHNGQLEQCNGHEQIKGARTHHQVASEPGVGAAGTGEEEGVPQRAGGEGQRPGGEELGTGGEALHAAEREPNA